MKKLITILVIMMVLVGAVFAAQNEVLKVTATVDTENPVFDIYGQLTADSETDNEEKIGLVDSPYQTLASDKDPSEDNITVAVRLYQNNTSKYKGNASLTVEATRLNCVTEGLTGYHTYAPAVSSQLTAEKTVKGSATGQTDTVGLTIAVPTVTNNGTDAEKATVSYGTLTYTGIKIAPNDIDTFTLTWVAKDYLPAGSYEATIKLTYTPE